MPASPVIFEIKQPNSVKFRARLVGDEFANCTETEHGFTVAQDVDGYWCYLENSGSAILTGVYAHNPPPPALQKHVRPVTRLSKAFSKDQLQQVMGTASAGSFNGTILYILVEFTDRTGTYPEAIFASLIVNNIADYFNKASYGKVIINQANETYGTNNNGVIGWLNMGYDHPNTAGTTSITNYIKDMQLAKDAIIAADPFVNYAAYDTDGDGFVAGHELAIVVISAGFEASIGGAPSPSMWGHAYGLFPPVAAPVVDGVTVGSNRDGMGYAQFGEIHDSRLLMTAHPATMGIQVHELGHLIFGLPDLYDTDYSSGGIGDWGVMGGGSWGRKNGEDIGATPVLPCAWTKYNRGWVNGTIGSGTTSIYAAGSTSANASNSVYRVTTSNYREYFLAENRQNSGYDQGLQENLGSSFVGGVAIWHINDNMKDNADDSQRWVDLEAADGFTGTSIKGANRTDLWYSGNKTTFNNTSSPNSKLYDGSSSNVSISNISSSSNIMTAVWPTIPVLGIKANNSDLPITIASGEQLDLTISLDTGDHFGTSSDWWLFSKTASGWKSYSTNQGWVLGATTTYQQGDIYNLNDFPILSMSGLAAFTYTFCFAIDMVMDGRLTRSEGLIYFDCVDVTVD